MNKDITNMVVRFEKIEDKVGIVFEGVFCEVEEYSSNSYGVKIHGEMHKKDGSELDICYEVHATAIDSKGRIIGKGANANYVGYDPFGSFEIIILTSIRPAKIRLYPVYYDEDDDSEWDEDDDSECDEDNDERFQEFSSDKNSESKSKIRDKE